MSDNILVSVRLRPLIPREIKENSAIHWQLGEENTIFQVDPVTSKAICPPYRFDRVFGMDYENDDIFCSVAESIVQSALAGFNGTIFAYGQTSSGKTHTMMGDRSNPGVIPMAIQNIFYSIENNPNREYLIRVSFMEIYNEAITDLLATRDPKSKGLTVREDASGAVYVVDLKEECVNSEDMLLSLMRKGNKNRHVGATNMNDKSSRSHTIFRLIIESRERTDSDDANEAITVSHLNLVDLAGSENASQTGATGERLKEGGFINKSLFMLGRVISQLSEGDQFVNFRDSKLTRILQSSLGGNAKTAIVCTVTPVGIDQTHSTLRFASRAKSIKNKPIINEVLSEAALLKRYAKEIKNLQLSLDKERKTDKAQEVEQVREMLDEKERINQELLKKINDLKTKLIVSSHPKETKVDKKKKLRRETWAAPRALRAIRMSMAPVNIEPVSFDSNFLEPRLPLLAGLRKISEESGRSEESDLNASAISDGFGREVSFTNDLAEQSKLDKLENSFDSLNSSEHKPWKRVHFKIPNQGGTVDVECQTEDSLVPQFKVPLQPQTPAMPGTPTHILRLRNKKLLEEVSKKEDWLNDWEQEMRTLAEYHSVELAVLDESFQRKMADGPIDYEKLEEKEREIKNLQHSLSDSEGLLLDANRSLSEKKQELLVIQGQLQDLLPKSLRLTEVEKELTDLRNKHEETLKTLDEKEERLSQLENDRKDFDMMMELALEKQRVKEKDLRKSLDDAWREIAEHENSNAEVVKDRHKRMTLLEAELTELRVFKSDVYPDELKEQLQEALAKQQEYEDQLKEQSIQLSQVLVLEEKVKKMETQVSEIEILKTELYKAEDLAKMFEKENSTLRNDIELLQSALKQKEGSDETKRIQELELEVELLREKLEGVENADSTLGVSPPSQPNSSVTSKISRKLSETLQVLEESMMMPTTPGTNSTSFCETFIQPHDVAAIKQQLLDLQAALVAQELQYQNQKDQQDSNKDALLNQMISTEIEAKIAAEVDLWKLTESFYVDYVSHSTQFFGREMVTSPDKFRESVPNVESTGVPNINVVQNTIAETTVYKDAYDTKFRGDQSTLEGGSSQDSTANNTFYTSVLPSEDGTTSSASMEMTLNDCFDISILDAMSVGNEEQMTLKDQLKILKEEKSHLVSQVKHLKKELELAVEKKLETFGSVSVESPDNSVLSALKPRHGAVSLADELRDVGVNGTFCNDTFETSVFEMEVNPVQENETLKQQLELLNSENVSLQNKVLQLQMQSSSLNNSIASGDASTPLPVSQHDSKETEMKKLQSEKSILELEVKNLKDELSMIEEEVHSLRWQVQTLKEENSYLEEDMKIYESEVSCADSEACVKKVGIDEEVSQQGKLINEEEVLSEKLSNSECKSGKDYDESVPDEEQLGKETVQSEGELQSITNYPGQKVEEIDSEMTCEKGEDNFSKTYSEAIVDSQVDNNELESIKASLNIKVKLLEELEIDLEKVKGDLVEKTKELAENEVKVEDLKVKEEELYIIKNELELIKTSHSDKLKVIEEIEKNHELLKEELDVKAKELDENKAMMENLQGKEKELEDVRNELEFIKTSLSDKVKIIEENEKNHELLREELEVKAKELAEKKALIEDLNGKEKELDDAKNEREVIKMDLAHKVELLGEVEKNVEQLKESLAVKARELDENISMNNDLKSKEEELDNVKKELEATKTDLKLKVREVEDIENNLIKLKEDLDVKTIELVETKAVIEGLGEKENELQSIKADLCHKEELLREVEKNCEELRENLIARTKTLEETKCVLEELQEKHSKENSEEMSSSKAEESELALAQEKIRSLEQELETQQKNTEEKIASIVDEKESELEGVITNFMEKEEAFEKRINALVEVEKRASTKDEVKDDLGQKCSSLQVVIENLESTLVMKGADLLALEEKCQDIQNCLSDATKELDIYKEKGSAQMSEMEDLRKKLDAKEDMIKTTEEEKDKLRQELDQVMISLDEQKTLLKEKEQEENLKESCDQFLDDKNNSVQEKEDSERIHILEKLDELEKLRNDHQMKILECNELKDSLYNLKTMKEKIEEKLAQAKEEHKLEIAFYSEDMEKKDSKIQLLEVEVKEKSEREIVINAALEAEANKIKRLEKEVEEIKNSKERFIMENEHMMENAQLETSQKVKELEVEIERLIKLSEELSEDRKMMIETINTKEQSSKDLLTTYDSLKNQLETLQDEHDRLKKLYEAQNSDMLMKSERTSLLEKEFDELKQKVQDLMEEKTKLQNDLEVKQMEMEQKDKDKQVLESELENMKSEVLDLNSRLQTMKDQHEAKSNNIEQLVAIIEKFENDMVVKDNQLTEAAKWEKEALSNEERVKNLQGEMETQNMKLSGLEKSVKDLHKENEDLKKMNSKMEKDALNSKRLSGEIGTLEENLVLTEKSLGEVQSQLDLERRQHEKDISIVVCEKQDLVNKLKAKEEELTRVMLDGRNDIEEIQNLKDELKEKIQEISKLSSELDSLKEKLASLMDISKASEQKILQQNVEMQSLKENKMLQEKEFKEIHNSNSQKIDGLVKIIEKLENDISLKQEEMIARDKEHAIEIANKSEEIKSLVSEVTNNISKLAVAEESLKSLRLEKTELSQKLSEHEKQLSDFKLESIKSNTITDLESEVSNDSNEKIQVESVLAENKDLAIKLLKTEQQLKTVKEELESKKIECSKLDTEMEEMIEHFRKESKEMTDTLFSRTQDLEKTETELKETKLELSSKSQLVMDTTSSDSLVADRSVHDDVVKALREELAQKEQECIELNKEMDDMVEHYRVEIQEMNETLYSQTENIQKMEAELNEAKEKLSNSHMTINTSSSDTLVADKSVSDDLVKTLREEFCNKEQECLELNKEMDEMVEHFRKETKKQDKELEEMSEKLEKTKFELSETHSRLHELTLTRGNLSTKSYTEYSSLNDTVNTEFEQLIQQKANLEKEIVALKNKYAKLEEQYSVMEKNCSDLKKCNVELQEEVKIGSTTTDSLLERLGDFEKLKAIWSEEKESLTVQIEDYKKEIAVLRKSVSAESAGEQIDKLLHKIKILEKELEVSNKNLENLAEECSGWKRGYTNQFEACENLKEKVKDAEIKMQEYRLQSEEKIKELSTQLNTVLNKSSLNNSSANVSLGKRKSKVAVLEEQNDKLMEEVGVITAKNEQLKSHLENLRKSSGIFSSNEEFNLELSLIKEKLVEIEKERDLLNRNYDMLEKENEALKEENDLLASKTPVIGGTSSNTLEQLQRENAQLQVEIALLKKAATIKSEEMKAETDTKLPLEDRFVELERENSELRFRLRALNAPAEKEVQTLKEELSNANAKVTHLKAELRRIQNSNNVDSTICEIRGAPVRSNLFDEEEENEASGNKFDYSSKSGIVSEVQVMILQNKLYSLEKEKKKLQSEHRTMEQHVEHYRTKAQEWKDTSMKERKTGEKIKKEVESWRTETNRLRKEVEDCHSEIERLQFEIGNQRQMLEKFEKEKRGESQPEKESGSRCSVSTTFRTPKPVQLKDQGSDEIAATRGERMSEPASHLRSHNADIPSRTRIESLSADMTPSNPQKTAGNKEPLWYSAYKENKDYSKYKLPPGSSQKKKEEECKTQ